MGTAGSPASIFAQLFAATEHFDRARGDASQLSEQCAVKHGRRITI